MKIILFTFGIYVFLLNLLTSYRLYKDELYEPWQKAVQFLVVWLVPLVGGMFSAVMLNRTLSSEVDMPKYLAWLGVLFFLTNNSTQGYPSSMNDYSDYGGGVEPGCHVGDGGGCGGE